MLKMIMLQVYADNLLSVSVAPKTLLRLVNVFINFKVFCEL